MSTQIRTWTERCNAEGEPLRWDLAINDRPVPGGYIEKTANGFEIHYPHLAPKTLDTLDEAKRRLELAPPISAAGLKVEKMAGEGSDLISSTEAGEMLGVSRFRVNAMVASGVLPGRRENGKILVDRAAVERKAAQGATEGPQGKFANLFLFYAPAGERTQYMAELEADDADAIERARAFAQEVMEDESEDAVEVRDYLRMRNFLRNHENEFEFSRTAFADLTQERGKRVSLRTPEVVA
ncbi:helix-turn-helix domain-containing protein [Adlercreutzia sp. R25]|uniref:Helix-turn-helix domain-containing protein n=1 Tax=Adlercreutzia shanghongiae TaxID=3111773 RepID=A0ABU6IYU4_9ACTN|nr:MULTISPECIES: helix-turn-helix domain-containing protein [unclassified Adlercreutzia]MEC4271663.1 helix-turn-helix domain-containing protein [Adlercreutzia sp. R25]MEC4294669.1 helix-turn-helix domain-containing protein [Adlercreutzia sp. R22]